MRSSLKRASLALCLLLASTFAHATTIDTIPAWNGTNYVYPFGIPDTATYGQVITVPAGSSHLESFTFLIDVPTTIVFRAEVYAWDGNKATGPALYESAPQSTASTGYHEVTFNTGAVAVTAGAQYVIFVSNSKDQVGNSGANGHFAALTAQQHGVPGSFVYQNNQDQPAAWTTGAWSGFTNDLAFRAVFDGVLPVVVATPVPAMSPVGLLALMTVLFGVAGFTLRRARRV